MASLNGVLTYLEHIDSKKNSLRKAILTLAVEWKDLDEHLDSTKNCVDVCINDLELKQKSLESNQEFLAKSSRELDEARELLDIRLKEFEHREEEFRLFQLAQVEELEKKEKQLGDVRMWIQERIGECEMREENLSVQKKSMEVLLQKIEMEKEEFEEIQKSVGEKLQEIHLKERNYEDLCKEVSSIQDRMETWAKELNLKEEQLVKLQKLNEERGNEFEIIVREYEINKERLNVEKRSMEMKLEKFEMERKEFEETKNSVEEKLNEISFKERNCDSLSREANLIQDWIETRSRELYAKEEEFNVKEEQLISRQRLNEDRTEELDFMAREYELKEKKLEMEKEEFQKRKNFVDKRWKEICTKEKECEHRFLEVNSIENQMKKRARELGLREEQVALREEQLKEMQKMNEECCEEFHLFEKECKEKEEKLIAEKKSIREQLGNIEKEKKQLEGCKVSVADKLNEINLKERNLEDRAKELNSIQDWIERRAKELDLSEERFSLREQNLKALEKLNKDRSEELDVMVQECKFKEEKLSMEEKSIEVLLQKINKEKEKIDSNKKSIADKWNEIALKERNCEDMSKEVNLLRDQIDKRARELDSKEKQVASREHQLEAELNKELREEVGAISQECKLKREALNVDISQECSKREAFNVDRTPMEVMCEKMEKEKKQFEDSKRSVADELTSITMKEKNCNRLCKEVSGILEQIEMRAREFGSKKERFALRGKQIMAMKKLNKERSDELVIFNRGRNFIEERLSGVKKSMEVILEEIVKEKEYVLITQESILKEEIHGVSNKSMEVLLEKFEKLKAEFKDIKKSVGKRLKDISLKETNYEDLSKEVQLILDRVEKQAGKLDSIIHSSLRAEQQKEMQKLNEEHSLEPDVVPQELDSSQELNKEQSWELDTAVLEHDSAKISSVPENLNCKGKQVDLTQNGLRSSNKQFNADQKLFEVCCKELDSKKKQLEELLKYFESKQKQFEERLKDFESKQKQFEVQTKNLRSKEKKLEEKSRENLCKEKRIENIEDGRSLLVYVNKHYKKCPTFYKKMCEILQSSSDPAKLVLEATEGFYPHLINGDVDLETPVARRSCILLLQKLMHLSPQIQPHIREAALKLAGEWKVKMKVYPRDISEVEAFILLLASYKLASDFDAVELLEYMELCAAQPQALLICRALDLAEKVPDLISSLKRNNKHWIAVNFIAEFELVKSYPPVPLLKDYLQISEKLIRARCKQQLDTGEAQDNALDERITCIRNVIKCLKRHKIEAGKWYYELENMLCKLREQKSRKRTEPPIVATKAVQNCIDNNFNAPTTASVTRKHYGYKKVFSSIIAHMDGRNLLAFLNKHVEEQEHMRKEVNSALQLISDNAKLVLDVIQELYNFLLVKGDCDIEATSVRTCTFLLEILMTLSPVIKPPVESVAKGLAIGWKSILMKQSTNEITLVFLLFVATYGLNSCFDSDELLKLYQTIGEHKQVPNLICALGFSEEMTVSSSLHQSVPEDVQPSNTAALASASDVHPSWNGVPDTIRYAFNPAQLVLDGVEGCYYSMLTHRNISKVEVIGHLSFLLNRLLKVPLEIKPQVRDQVTKFAADWNKKLKQHHRMEVGCILLFLAVYKVVSSFPLADLLNLLEIAYDDRGTYTLFRSLGLSDEIPDFIRRLIERGEHLSAIKYVYAFELVNIFSPFCILEDYIKKNKEETEKICERGQNSPESRDIASKLEKRAFKAMKDFICFHQLDVKPPFKKLKSLVEQWEIQIYGCKGGPKQKKRRNRLEPHHHPDKRQRAASSAETMNPNCSESTSQPFRPPYHHLPPGEFWIERSPNVLPSIGDYFPGASSSVFPYQGYQMFGFGNGGNFDPGLNYNAGPGPWGPVVPHPNLP